MKIERVFVSPDFAASLLKKNTKNRPVSRNILLKYIDEMRNGKWKEDTGELIKISDEEAILDGQHRLAAVVRSGIGFHFHIATGVPSEVFDVLDTGKRRNGADALGILGETYRVPIAAAISMNNWISSEFKANRGLPNSVIVDEYNKDKELWSECAKLGLFLSKTISSAISPSFTVAFLFHLSLIDKQEAFDFMRQVCEGKQIKNNTIHLLRRRLIDSKVSKQYRLDDELMVGLILKTWNAFRKGYEIGVLRYKPAEETFPKAI